MLRKMPLTIFLSLLVCICACSITPTCGNIVKPDGTQCSNGSSPCLTLDHAMHKFATGELGSNTTLELFKGTHTVKNVNFVRDLVDVKIVGLGEPSAVVVTCSETVGLVFINVSRLVISNLTIQHCGLNDTAELFDTAFSFIDSFFQPPPLFSVGFSLISCSNVRMEDVNFTENVGFGMLAINVVGSSTLSRTHFFSNHPSTCVIDPLELLRPGGAGGGAFFLFSDYKDDYQLPESFGNITSSELTFEDSFFMHNYACRIDLFALLFMQLPRSISPIQQQVYNITRAGGLSLILSQGSYHQNVSVDSCHFENNTSTYNGAALEAVQFENTNDCHVTVKHTRFQNNGGVLIPRYGRQALDPVGAVLAAFYLRVPVSRITTTDAAGYILHMPSTFSAINCTFIGNIAHNAGGLMIFSFGPAIGFVQDRAFVLNSTFERNMAIYGPAMYITELSYSGFEPGLEVFLQDVTFTSNEHYFTTGLTTTETGVIDINYLNVFFSGYNNFSGNSETVITAFSSILTFKGTSIFRRNTGLMGGAFHLVAETYLVLLSNATVILEENTAQVGGGGVFVNFDLSRTETYYDCFMYFDGGINPFCNALRQCDMETYNASFQFINNRAPYGSAIFGSALSNCPWGEALPNDESFTVTPTSANKTITFLNNLSPLLDFTPSVEQGNNVINTISQAIFSESNVADKVRYGIMPGQEFILTLGAFDQLRQPVPLTIFSQVDRLESEETIGARASIGETDRYLLTGGSRFTNVPINIYGNEGQSFNVTISTNEANVRYIFSITLSSCQKGFQFNKEKLMCTCLVNKTLSEVQCQPDGSINYPANAWIGQDTRGDFILHECISDYCEPMVTDLNLTEADDQCNNHRSGILCGECLPGYSRVLGTSSCEHCTNNAYLALIIPFGFVGIILVAAVAYFKITISDGYLNGFIFYANVLSILTSEFLRQTTVSSIVVGSFLNLDLGIETCFYNGMNQLAAVGLEFVFPFYLAGILLAITLFSRIWSRFKLLKDFNAAQVFATLLLLSYSSIIRTCIEILGFLTIDSPSGVLVKWRGDPNVEYFTGVHIVLAIVSILLLLVLVPLPIPLLFPSLIFKVKRLVRLKPLLDAFVAPFDTKRRYWLGFRLVCRLVLLLVTYLGAQNFQILFVALFLAVLVMVQSYLRPFSTRSRNFVDLSLLLNLTLLSIVALYLRPKDLTLDRDVEFVILGFTLVVTVEFFFLVLYYILKAIPVTRKMALKGKETLVQKWEDFKNRDKSVVSMFVKSKVDLRVRHTSVHIDAVVNDSFETADFVTFRESLLN